MSLRLWRETRFLNQSRVLISYLYHISSKLRFYSQDYIEHHFDSRQSFTYPDSRCQLYWHVTSCISDCVYSLMMREKYSSLQVKLLRNYRKLWLSKYISRSNDRVKRTKPCIVSIDFFFWDSHLDEVCFHRIRFIVLYRTIVSTNDYIIYLPCIIKLFCCLKSIKIE